MHKELRLRKKEDFNKVYRYGKSMANRQFVVYYIPQQAADSFRLGVSVSKKIGNAVVRNKLRRRMKEIVRLHADRIKQQTDLVLIARNGVGEMSYQELEKSIIHVLSKSGILRKNGIVSKS